MRLLHYCCRHSYQGIAQTWRVVPVSMLVEDPIAQMPWHPLPELLGLAWFTDMDPPDRVALGLTNVTLKCDRAEKQLAVLEPWKCQPWVAWSSEHLDRRQQNIARDWLTGDWSRWWVATVPIAVTVPGADPYPKQPGHAGLAHPAAMPRRR